LLNKVYVLVLVLRVEHDQVEDGLIKGYFFKYAICLQIIESNDCLDR